jgi:Leucine-rich repeat (LRR) protein
LRLSGSSIGNFHPNTFRNQVNLQQLWISECGITSLHPDTFSSLHRLRHLSMIFNEIQELPPGIFTNLVSLGTGDFNSLFLISNKIRRLNAVSFGVHPNLTEIILTNNRLYAIERGMFGEKFPNLMTLSVTQNDCVNDVVVRNFDESPQLEYCFANWLGETTSTTTEGGAGMIAGHFGVFFTVFVVLMGF